MNPYTLLSCILLIPGPLLARDIDPFTTAQGPIIDTTNDNLQVSDTITAPETISGERRITATVTTTATGSTSAEVVSGQFVCSIAEGSDCSTDYFGADFDITDGGAEDRIEVSVSGTAGADSGQLSIRVTLEDVDANRSGVPEAVSLVASTSFSETLVYMFSDFDSSVDLTRVDNVTIRASNFTSEPVDMELQMVETTPVELLEFSID